MKIANDLPVLNVCDFFSKNSVTTKVAVHDLRELLKNDVFIPKKPHRHSFYQILYIEKGSGQHRIDFKNFSIEAPMVFFLSPGQVHNLGFENTEIEGFMVNFSEDYFSDFLARKEQLEELNLFKKNGEISLIYLWNELGEFKGILNSIASIFKQKPIFWLEKIRVKLLELFYLAASEIQINQKEIIRTKQLNILRRFEELIEKHYSEWHHPQYYADQLSITSNYLNAKCKTVSGKTAGQWIRNRLILEAKRLLVNSEFSISEISYKLNFEDNSYFTKFFKSSTGLSPSDFRKSLNK